MDGIGVAYMRYSIYAVARKNDLLFYGILRTYNNLHKQLSSSYKCSFRLHRVSKKLCQLIFCSFSVKYEPISIKIGRIVPKDTLHKTVPRVPTSPKVCACTTLGNLKCQIEPSTQ